MSKLVYESLNEWEDNLDEAFHLRNPLRKKGKPGEFKPSKEWKARFADDKKSQYKDRREAAGIPDLENMEEWEKDELFPGRKHKVEVVDENGAMRRTPIKDNDRRAQAKRWGGYDNPADQGMAGARKDNYQEEDANNVLDKAFNGLGITVDDDGIIHPTNKIAKILCNMAVKDGKFEKVAEDAYVAL